MAKVEEKKQPAKQEKKEKVYLTRDEGSDWIYIWRKPTKGNWSPQPMKGAGIVTYDREEVTMETVDTYLATDFKKKFGMTIREKTKKCVHLPTNQLYNEDYKLFSNNPDRKQ
jgi:hypothetical protein